MADEPTTYPYGLTLDELILLDGAIHDALCDAVAKPHPVWSDCDQLARAHQVTRRLLDETPNEHLLERAGRITGKPEAA
jgi:hypothetical protein